VALGHSLESDLEEHKVLQETGDGERLRSRLREIFRGNVLHLVLCAVVLLFCGYLRFVNLDWGMGKKQAGRHPDEVIVGCGDCEVLARGMRVGDS
jgi:hypothetical protein